ncbi:MAG TPA: GNAT family N-acetyltransferase [Armatimonadota bacterium]|jgi:RimJ/RimL family protein N-acetyltransferase
MRIHLETERLILRDFDPDDVDNLVALDADPEVRRYLDMPEPPTRHVVECVILPPILADAERRDGFGRWIILEKARDFRFIGWIHFRRAKSDPDEIELGYRLIREAWGHGYATEASLALIEKGIREQGVTRISATALADNAASIRVMEKCGLTLENRFMYKDIPAVKYSLRVP